MVWYLLNERNRLLQMHSRSSKEITQLNTAAQEEMKEWIKLTDKFADELKQFKRVCKHCGIPLTPDSINTYCKYNVGETGGGPKVFGSKGTSLHFFEKIQN